MNSILKDFKVKITPTPRERELITLIARGMQNKNIAYELRISENTVRAHIGNIMRKYRLQNRTQIAIFFAREATPFPRQAKPGVIGFGPGIPLCYPAESPVEGSKPPKAHVVASANGRAR